MAKVKPSYYKPTLSTAQGICLVGGPWFVGCLHFFSQFIFASSWLPHVTCEIHTSKTSHSKLHIEKLWFVKRNNLASILIKPYPAHLYRQHPNVIFCISTRVSCPHWVAMGLYCCYITILIFQPLFFSGYLSLYKNISLFTKHLTLYLVGEKVTLHFLVGSKCVCLFVDSFPCFWGSDFGLPRWTLSVLVCLLDSFHFLRPQIQPTWAINSVWCVMRVLGTVDGCVRRGIF